MIDWSNSLHGSDSYLSDSLWNWWSVTLRAKMEVVRGELEDARVVGNHLEDLD